MRSFEKAIKSLDSQQKREIEDATNRLLQNPYSNDNWYKGNMRGKHKKYVMNKKLRLVFAICDECRKLGHINYNDCHDCQEQIGMTITLFDVIKRSDDYR